MAVKLSPTDFRKLASIIQNLPNFANVRDRRRLLTNAMAGESNTDIILAQLDLDGAPMDVAGGVILFLLNFGPVTYGKESLGVFLNYVQSFIGNNEDRDFIVDLFTRYPLNEPINPVRPIDRWRGTDNAIDIQEKIIGENTLRHIRVLELILESAKAVVHVSTPGGAGTGFMVALDLLMTNNHVLDSTAVAAISVFTFDYQLGLDGKPQKTFSVSVHEKGIFYTNPELDYTVVQLKDVPTFGKPLVLKRIQVNRDDRVTIIQHPGGHLKKLSMQNNFVAYADTSVVQYTTSTMNGSSGSPVLNDDLEVIAIHHSGGMLIEPSSGRPYLRNGGTSMVAILDDLKIHRPEIYARLKG